MLILWGSPIFRGGGSQKTIYMGNCLKEGLGQFAGALAKNSEEGVFFGGGVDNSMRTMT